MKHYTNTPFSVELESVSNGPGYWNSTKFSIYRDEKLIGQFLRNYNAFNYETFYPFLVDGEWYALYSPDYTSTRVMKLYEDRIEDWCGEEPNAGGFCPTEFYVPYYLKMKGTYRTDGELTSYDYYLVDCDDEAEFKDGMASKDFVESAHCNFGFVSGCIWGDDTSWKIRLINLEGIKDKKFEIVEKFGYWEMPHNLKLKQCVVMTSWEPDDNRIYLTKMERINLDEAKS